MLGIFTKRYEPDLSLKGSIVRKLNRADTDEVVMWMDNIHSGIAKNISEIRKSLSRGDTEQALVYIADSKHGAVSLLAALESLEAKAG